MFTGFEGSEDTTGPDGPGFSGCFSGLAGLFEVTLFGRRLPGLLDEVEGVVFSFGRDVRNAPRTSSSCITGAAIPTTTAHKQTNPKIITLNRIIESPYWKFFLAVPLMCVPAEGLIVLNTYVEDKRIARLIGNCFHFHKWRLGVGFIKLGNCPILLVFADKCLQVSLLRC